MIYTDKKYLTADSEKELRDFVKQIDLESLVCLDQMNNKSCHIHVPLFDDTQVKLVIDNGAKIVSTEEIVELSERCASKSLRK